MPMLDTQPVWDRLTLLMSRFSDVEVQQAIDQLAPGLPLDEISCWFDWVEQQPDYYISTVGQAHCVTRVVDTIDPPWQRVAIEVAWWGHGRDAVRALHRGMEWAKLQRAVKYAYSLIPRLDILYWRVL